MANWVEITSMGDRHQIELDVEAEPPRYRHRPLNYNPCRQLGFERGHGEWKPGHPDDAREADNDG